MRVDRNTDLRLAHDRPDGWWARVNWDYEHMNQEERQAQGARNLVIIFIIIGIGLVALAAAFTGSVFLGICFMLWFVIRAGYRPRRRYHRGYW